jgi:Fe-S cluster assembly ATPase SufC
VAELVHGFDHLADAIDCAFLDTSLHVLDEAAGGIDVGAAESFGKLP